jgi:hypothetical protein
LACHSWESQVFGLVAFLDETGLTAAANVVEKELRLRVNASNMVGALMQVGEQEAEEFFEKASKLTVDLVPQRRTSKRYPTDPDG